MSVPTVIFILSDGPQSRGGIGRVTAYVSRALAARHPDIAQQIAATRLREQGVLKHLSVPLALWRFRKAARHVSSGIAHINIAPRGSTWRKMLFAHVAHAQGMKVVLHLHGSGYDAYFRSLSPANRARVSAFFRRADRVIALSDHWHGVLANDIGVPADRITIIANGVPDPGVAPHRPDSGAPHILFLGELGERKGTDILLQSLARLRDASIAYRATLAGNGDVDGAKAQILALGLTDRVTLPGWVDERAAGALLDEADIFVLPSRAENQPVSILEAMARALPVVGTAVGAIPDQIADQESGLVIAPGSIDELTNALKQLAENADLRESMGRNGRSRFEARFSAESAADQFAALYRSLID